MCTVALALGTAACAQEPGPTPDVQTASDEFPGVNGDYRDPYLVEDSVSADVVLDRLENRLDSGDRAGFDPIESLLASADSAQHFDRTLQLARQFAALDGEQYGFTTGLLYVLRALGARRPFFRALVRDAGQDVGMAAAAIRVLAWDPRREEYEEMRALNASLAPNGFGPLSHVLTEYYSVLVDDERYQALPTFEAKLERLRFPEPNGREAALLRELRRQRPGGVETWIAAREWPSSLSGESEQPPPIEDLRQRLRAIANASERFVPPLQIEGPMTPPIAPVLLCDGQPATVYVAPDGRVVGGPLAGQRYAGRLQGTSAADVIVGTVEPDVLFGGGGADLLCGWAGKDVLVGAGGADTADGGAFADGCEAETAAGCEGPVPVIERGVRPIGECVAPRADGGFTAHFGYDNGTGAVGRVPHGPSNEVALSPPSALGGPAGLREASPDLFAVPGVVARARGRTPPDAAFTVAVPAGRTVTWTLLGEAVTLSSASPVCPDP